MAFDINKHILYLLLRHLLHAEAFLFQIVFVSSKPQPHLQFPYYYIHKQLLVDLPPIMIPLSFIC